MIPSALIIGEFPSLLSLLGLKVPRAILPEQAKAALNTYKVMEEAQAQFKLKQSLKHQYPKLKDHLYVPNDKVLV